MKIDLGILFAFWLKDNKNMSYDDYVEQYKTNKCFRDEVNNQENITEYRKIKGESK